MMDIEEINVEIEEDGQVVLSVTGVSGSACLTLTEDLEKVLGNVLLERRMTSEAGDYLPPKVQKEKNPSILNGRKG